jgi:hypothetical protein
VLEMHSVPKKLSVPKKFCGAERFCSGAVKIVDQKLIKRLG